MNQQDKAKLIFNSFQKLKTLQRIVSGIDLNQAEMLSMMKKNNNFKIIMGDESASWKSFIAQPELQPLTVSKAHRLIKIYDTFIGKYKLNSEDILGIDSNSLLRLVNVVNEQNVKIWLNKAKNLSRSDLYREIRYGHVNEGECEHEFEEKKILTCKFCGYKKIIK